MHVIGSISNVINQWANQQLAVMGLKVCWGVSRKILCTDSIRVSLCCQPGNISFILKAKLKHFNTVAVMRCYFLKAYYFSPLVNLFLLLSLHKCASTNVCTNAHTHPPRPTCTLPHTLIIHHLHKRKTSNKQTDRIMLVFS